MNIPDILQTTSIAQGVGDLQDLQLMMGVGESGRWVGFIRAGWYYKDSLEQYRYVLPQTTTTTLASGATTINAAISYRPAWGPVLVYSPTASSISYNQYTQHANSYSPANTMTWTYFPAYGLWRSNIDNNLKQLVGVRDLTQLPLGAVSARGLVTSEKVYYLDPGPVHAEAYVLWVKSPSTPTIYADLVTLAPSLKMREVVAYTDQGVKASYSVQENLTISRGSQTMTLTGPVSGWIDPTGSLDVQLGDWVVMEYYIPRSYVLTDHNQIQIYTTAATGEQVTINWEGSVPDLLPAISATAPATGIINFNPLFSDSYRVGYVFDSTLTQAASSYWSVGGVEVALDKKWASGALGEPFKATITVTDRNGIVVPKYPVALSMSAGATILFNSPTPSAMTDGRGEIHLLVRPASGLTSFYVRASTSVATGFASGQVLNTATTIPSAIFQGGQANVVVSKRFTPRRYYRSYTSASYLDGIPRGNIQIVLNSELASVFEYGQNLNTSTITLYSHQTADNPFSIIGLNDSQQFGYLPQPTDRLRARTAPPVGQSTITIIEPT